MAHIQYLRNVTWDVTLSDLGLNETGLVITALKTTTGAPTATAGRFAPAAIIQNIVSGLVYINAGSTASPSWEVIEAGTIALADNNMLVGNASGVAEAVSISHVIKYGGTFTTAGGDANETITVTGAAATDIVAVTVKTAGATPRSIVSAAAATNAINVVMSGDPSTDHVLQYIVFRAA